MGKANQARPGAVGKKHWIGLVGVCVAAYLLFVHVDVLETAGHTWVFLESLFSGRLLDFYEVVVQRPTDLYYLNYANYNIAVYFLYGLFQMPYYAVLKLAGGEPDSFVLVYLAKLVALGFHFACVWLVAKIGLAAGFQEPKAAMAALAYGISVPVVFSAPVMGQYDSVCLFFILLSLLQLLRGKMRAFVLWAGLGMAFKFFCVFIFIPLLLLFEKKWWRALLYGVAGLWFVAPTTLIYWGHNGSQSDFMQLMLTRLFRAQLPAGYNLPVFGLCFFLLCVLCWLWRPQNAAHAALWAGRAVFGILFFFIEWHPQWIAVLSPFMVLIAAHEKNLPVWLAGGLLFSLGYLGFSVLAFPGHFGDNLLDMGFWGVLSGVGTARRQNALDMDDLLAKVPMMIQLCAVLFFGVLLLWIVFSFPFKKGSLAARLSAGAQAGAGGGKKITPARLWAVFGVCMGGWFMLLLPLWVRRVAAL